MSQAWSLPTCLGSPQSEGSGHIFWDNCIGTYNWTKGDFKGAQYEGEWKDDKKHGQGTYTSAEGEKYVGEYKNDKMHGQGTYTFADGDKYIGGFKDDKKHGQGTYTSAEGEKYVGEYKNDKMHGQGTLTLTEGDKYVGGFKDDAMHGQGTITSVDGRILQGQFKDGEWINGKEYAAGEYNPSSEISSLPTCLGSPQSEGSGHIFWDNCIGTYNWTKGDFKGAQYEGEWKDDKKHGQGTIAFAEGDTYVGEFKNDNFHGHGTRNFANGDKYVGEYKNDKMHGHGIGTFANGNQYEGEWKDNERNGQGVFIFGKGEWEGDKYVGKIKDNKKHGQGTYFWADGEVWQGQFKDDEWINGKKYAAGEYNFSSDVSSLPTCKDSPQTEGSGHIFWDNCIGTYNWTKGDFKGVTYLGEWKDDTKHGQGTYTTPEGDKYVGEFKYGARDGQGTYTFGKGEWEGDIYVGAFKDSNMHGQGTYTFADGEVWQGQFKDDEWINGKKYAAGEYNPSIEENNNNKQNIDPNKIINAASGSGFIISSSGHVITNNHVIEGCNEVKIHYNGEKYKASIIAKDDYNDIALLKANFTPSIIFSIKNGNAELLEDIYVAGYPFGDFFNSSVKITKGIVSSLSGFKNNFSNMQIDAALQPGNSGGPVIDYKGNVVGVAVAKLDLSTMVEIFDSVPENTNFAIKSSVVLNFLNANGIQTKKASEKIMARSKLSETITKGTLFLSCWMTQARIEEMKTQKVLFNNIIK